ncbi:MAG TPA: 3-oxoacyl-ACP reductase FabG, partial [Candidatus Polarisedimenticolia bacterium]|nr:3-oxoacyl-ACP reductase FabG [Candidatus Polarisedimenticolia bacterium]
IALELARRGATVVVAARQAAALEETAALCRAEGATAYPIALDLADPASIDAGVKAALAAGGKIDHLVNNAGVTADGLFMRMKREAWETVLGTNLTGAFEVTRAVLPGMVRARFGRVVNISSVVALSGNPGQANYCAAKAGLIGLTKSLAREVASRQITVNAVAPGFIDTDMTRSLTDEQKAAMAAQIPLGRVGRPEEIARAVGFLVGPGGDYITGHVLNVSGGLYM